MNKQEILRKLDEIKALLTEEQEQEETRPEFINDLYSWDELQRLVQSGKASEQIAVGDKLRIVRNGSYIVFDVIKITDDKIYLISHYLVTPMIFDASEPKNPDSAIANYGSNDYLNSSIRQWLNSSAMHGDWWEKKTEYDEPIECKDFLNGFMCGICGYFRDILLPDENGDKFFLPSESEIEEWFPNEKDRIKTYTNGRSDWYRTRTPTPGDLHCVDTVGIKGVLSYNFASDLCGVAPCCIIG